MSDAVPERLSDQLQLWAKWVASGYEVPAAAQCMTEAAAALTTAQARIAELEAALALRTGGDHDPDCKACRGRACNCGHFAALRALEAKP